MLDTLFYIRRNGLDYLHNYIGTRESYNPVMSYWHVMSRLKLHTTLCKMNSRLIPSLDFRFDSGTNKELAYFAPIMPVYDLDENLLGLAQPSIHGLAFIPVSSSAMWKLEDCPIYLDSVKLYAKQFLKPKGDDIFSSMTDWDPDILRKDPRYDRYLKYLDVAAIEVSGQRFSSADMGTTGAKYILVLPYYDNVSYVCSLMCYNLFTSKIKEVVYFDDVNQDNKSLVDMLLDHAVNLKKVNDDFIISLASSKLDLFEITGTAAERAAWQAMYPSMKDKSVDISLKDVNIANAAQYFVLTCPKFHLDQITVHQDVGREKLVVSNLSNDTHLHVEIGGSCHREVKLLDNCMGSVDLYSDNTGVANLVATKPIRVVSAGTLHSANILLDSTALVECRSIPFGVSLTANNIDDIDLSNCVCGKLDVKSCNSLRCYYVNFKDVHISTVRTFIYDRNEAGTGSTGTLTIDHLVQDLDGTYTLSMNNSHLLKLNTTFRYIEDTSDFRLVLDLTDAKMLDVTLKCKVYGLELQDADDKASVSRYIDLLCLAFAMKNTEIKVNPGTRLKYVLEYTGDTAEEVVIGDFEGFVHRRLMNSSIYISRYAEAGARKAISRLKAAGLISLELRSCKAQI